jgi:hypothetical protein
LSRVNEWLPSQDLVEDPLPRVAPLLNRTVTRPFSAPLQCCSIIDCGGEAMTEQYRQTPREILEQKLAKERKNSPVMKALIDKAEFELVHEDPHFNGLYRILDRISRRRKMKRGEEYSTAAKHETWIEISRPYLENLSDPEKRQGKDFVTYLYDQYREVLFDLKEINERRSRKRKDKKA